MKIFESLNCTVCKKPFARVANQPRSPRVLDCGSAMCHQCFENEKSLQKEERKHQCEKEDCFKNPNFAYFMLDVLKQEDSLILSQAYQGYLLAKYFKTPECPICHEIYSMNVGEKKSFALGCGHVICTKCSQKIRTKKLNDDTKEKFKYEIICPICKEDTLTNSFKLKDRFHDFLKELPEMRKQLVETSKKCQCKDCHKMEVVFKTLYCGRCKAEICGFCAYTKHLSHGVKSKDHMALAMEEELRKELSNLIKKSKHLSSKRHEEILDKINHFETQFYSLMETFKNASDFDELLNKNGFLSKMLMDFKKIVEVSLPQLQECNYKLKKFTEPLSKDSSQG